MDNIILIGIIVICTVFLIGCVIKKRPDLILDFLLRAFVGTAAIYVLDFILRSKGYNFTVGINGVTVLSNGLLGFPGFILLYGLSIYYAFH